MALITQELESLLDQRIYFLGRMGNDLADLTGNIPSCYRIVPSQTDKVSYLSLSVNPVSDFIFSTVLIITEPITSHHIEWLDFLDNHTYYMVATIEEKLTVDMIDIHSGASKIGTLTIENCLVAYIAQ